MRILEPSEHDVVGDDQVKKDAPDKELEKKTETTFKTETSFLEEGKDQAS